MTHANRRAASRAGRILGLSLVLGLVSAAAGAAENDCFRTSVGLTPINDLGTGAYLGAQGGLYPGGLNDPPQAHGLAGRALAERVEPLDPAGRPDRTGKIVVLSIGISNAFQEFGRFMELASAAPVPTDVMPVNGAQGGATARAWADPTNAAWDIVDQRLAGVGVTPAQVQVVWVKATNQGSGRWPGWAEALSRDLAAVARILRDRFPTLKLVYLSSRTYGGYSTGQLSPEPGAYQSGFAVKWVIEDQIAGDPSLNFDPSRGPVEAPWLGWGPYLWADGLTPRSDGLVWQCSDFATDVHPSASGEEKVARMLLEFMHADPTTRPWFVGEDPAEGSADLSLAVDDQPDPTAPGSEVRYVLTVANAGPAEAQAMSMAAEVPVGTTVLSTNGGRYNRTSRVVAWELPSIPAGQDAFRTLELQVSPRLSPRLLRLEASVTSGTPDPDPADNSGEELTSVS